MFLDYIDYIHLHLIKQHRTLLQQQIAYIYMHKKKWNKQNKQTNYQRSSYNQEDNQYTDQIRLMHNYQQYMYNTRLATNVIHTHIHIHIHIYTHIHIHIHVTASLGGEYLKDKNKNKKKKK